MKKTLIALAVAASAVVSGSAMAWTASGDGGSVDLGGTLTPVNKVTPWEVKVGDEVTGLDANITKGQSEVSIVTNKVIPVLGIRTQDSVVFKGKPGISPQIDYKDAVNVNGFSSGETTVTLSVSDSSGQKIGTLTSPFSAAAIYHNNGQNNGMFSGSAGHAFYGGLGKSTSGGMNYPSSKRMIESIDASFTEKYVVGNNDASDPHESRMDEPARSFSGAYGSGILAGKTIKIALDSPAQGDAPIQWKASLPVMVTYQ
ncbi:hypothetical protein QSO38_002273 [Escherichia coli]|nr:hypothetical protein [Escherichia coli]